MAMQQIVVPQMGESIHEVTLIKLHIKSGDKIKVGDVIADLATDKVDTELVSTANGVVEHIFYTKEKSVISIGAVFAKIKNDLIGSQKIDTTELSSNQNQTITHAPIVETQEQKKITQKNIIMPTSKKTNHIEVLEQKKDIQKTEPIESKFNSEVQNIYLSPIVSQIIFEKKIQTNELPFISRSGQDSRITKTDVINYIQFNRSAVLNQLSNNAVKIEIASSAQKESIETEDESSNAYISKTEIKHNPGEGESLKMIDRMRQTISKNLKLSKDTNVQVTSFAEIDVTNIVEWREKNKTNYEEKTKQKLTYTPIFIEALIATLKIYPILNSVLKTDTIIERKNINIGIATALPDGNLIIPIIKKAQDLELVDINKKMIELITKARNNDLNFADIDGGTFTLTNIGTFNSLMGTPLLPINQSGILATGKIQKKPVIHSSNFRDSIVVRHMMFVSLSYDHRIIDGIVGGGFLNYFAQQIESFNPNRSLIL